MLKRLGAILKANRTKKYNQVRYGSGYKKTCAKAHESVDGRCILCGAPSTDFHHLHYWSWSRLLLDIWEMLNGLNDLNYSGLPGEVTGRERIKGWFADGVPVCEDCHLRSPNNLHKPQYWRSSKVLPVLFNRASFATKWKLRRQLRKKQAQARRSAQWS